MQILHSERGCQECIEPNLPKNVTPREDQNTRKRKISSSTFDLQETTDSKGACEKECKPNDPDGEHPTKRTKANHDDHDVKQSHTRHEPIVPQSGKSSTHGKHLKIANFQACVLFILINS